MGAGQLSRFMPIWHNKTNMTWQGHVLAPHGAESGHGNGYKLSPSVALQRSIATSLASEFNQKNHPIIQKASKQWSTTKSSNKNQQRIIYQTTISKAVKQILRRKKNKANKKKLHKTIYHLPRLWRSAPNLCAPLVFLVYTVHHVEQLM